MKGCERGIVVPAGLSERATAGAPVLVVRTVTDLLALIAAGLPAVTVPTEGGNEIIAAHLRRLGTAGDMVVLEAAGTEGGATGRGGDGYDPETRTRELAAVASQKLTALGIAHEWDGGGAIGMPAANLSLAAA